jgi:hypothetical protein
MEQHVQPNLCNFFLTYVMLECLKFLLLFYMFFFYSSLATIQAQVRRELEAEKKAAASAARESSFPDIEPVQQEELSSPSLAVTGVFFSCPMIG